MPKSCTRIWPYSRPTHGFTLVELMVVVVIITALSALAVPSIIKQMRDRRTRQAAEEVAAIYRQARLRALGRGSAVLVRYTKSNGSYVTREAVSGTGAAGCVQLPMASCTQPAWDDTDTNSQLLSTWSPPTGITSEVFSDNTTGYSGALGGNQPDNLDVCFTPMGRTLARFAITAGSPFQTMSGVPVIRVRGADTTRLKRHVLIIPNGLARSDVAQ